ncbi:MAG: hypothetical protein M3Z41_08505 [Candidatus Eremiobacteraeota bacterium]|nr:hypothetical protein [Candidatus Eremiobacteraeota bacterium]
MRFEVQRQDPLTLDAHEPLSSMHVLSPYVWTENGRFEIAVRAVNRSDNPNEKVARVYHGCGDDGLHFVMDREPILPPGPDAIDAGGCEDPSVVSNGQYRVFYSGYNPVRREARLLLASGPSIHSLTKNGPVFPETTYSNTKEATVIELADRSWRLFFEYAKSDHSLIGLATSTALTGPWAFEDFPLQPRARNWDAWHLSPGPIVTLGSVTGYVLQRRHQRGALENWLARVGYGLPVDSCPFGRLHCRTRPRYWER